ncbi:phosphoribosylaminoimidazolesuccinocarboxamide synthase [Verrucomicrobia bacterium]|nr:phosphoribosylaminoimidazolesuccinocarboxamide synthase [Verrucomicrobiota bacterium]
MSEPVLQIDLPGIKHVKRGKVREVYDLGDSLLFVASDRISAYDCNMPNGIPRKGEVLTQISHFWFDQTGDIIRNHRLALPSDPLPEALARYEDLLNRRSMIVEKTKPLAIECVVRGYLAGSGWKEYQKNQAVCGIELPAGLLESSKLPEPIYTPATKAEEGHDENISYEESVKIVGEDIAAKARELSLKLYQFGADYALPKGIILADTKFEFGVTDDGELILIDEALTPDSSRFWPADDYAPGRAQMSYDKQFVRDYLETLDWDKTPPAPALPDEIVNKTAQKYQEAYLQLTGKSLDD